MTLVQGLGLLGFGMVATFIFFIILGKAFEYERKKHEEDTKK